jgi:hypothetical protein
MINLNPNHTKMKNLLYILAFVGLSSISYAQVVGTIDVPAPVQKAFAKTNPKISNADWKQTGDSYSAFFRENDMERSITYAPNGKFQQKEEQVTIGKLPTETLKYINDNHPDKTIKKVWKITQAGGKTFYRVNLNDMELTFDSLGKYQLASK